MCPRLKQQYPAGKQAGKSITAAAQTLSFVNRCQESIFNQGGLLQALFRAVNEPHRQLVTEHVTQHERGTARMTNPVSLSGTAGSEWFFYAMFRYTCEFF